MTTTAMRMTRDDVIRSLKRLPKRASMRDVVYRVLLFAKLDAGLRDIAAGRVLTTDQALAWLRRQRRHGIRPTAHART